MFPLDDGSYDVVVVDTVDDGSGGDVHVELALTAGLHKGQVVRLRASGLDRDPLLLLGLPGTLVVQDGTPSLTID